MTNPFWFNLSPTGDPTKLKLLALPRWAELSLVSAGMTPDLVNATQYDFCNGDIDSFVERARTIMSSKEVAFHDELTAILDAYLFPSKNNDWLPKGDELYAKVVTHWHGVPLASSLDLCLHPVIVSPSVIALMHTAPIPGVTDVNLYERLVRCIYVLSQSKHGVNALNSDLFKAVLHRYMEHRQTVKVA